MGKRRFALAALDGHVQVHEAVDYGKCHLKHELGSDLIGSQIIKERAVLMELSDKPELSVQTTVDVVSGDEAQYVLVPEALGLIDLTLVLPRALVCRVERLHGHELATPLTFVHLAETAFADTRIDELDLARYGALHTLRHASARARAGPLELGLVR